MTIALGAALLGLAAAAVPPPAAPSPYRVGPGDVLEVTVEGRPDLDRQPTVQTTGAISLPRAGSLAVSDLTTDEIAERLGPLLRGPDLESPRIAVRVVAHNSQFVWTRGALVRPGRRTLRGGTRLVDALIASGGLSPDATGQLVLERTAGTFEDGSRRMTLRLPRVDPSAEELRALELALSPGDVITAAAQEWVLVTGAVRRPGRYPYDPALTISRLVATAGGLLPASNRRARVLRHDAGAGYREIDADLDQIRRGVQEDLALRPGDEVALGERRL